MFLCINVIDGMALSVQPQIELLQKLGIWMLWNKKFPRRKLLWGEELIKCGSEKGQRHTREKETKQTD